MSNHAAAKNAQDSEATSHPAALPSADAGDVTKRLADFVIRTQYDDISAAAAHRVRLCLLDFLGVGLLGAKVGESSAPFTAAIKAVSRGFPGNTTVLGSSERLPTQYAALLNGAYGHTLDFDDTHSGGIIHVAVSVVSSALAEAESHPDLPFTDFLTALAVGYEVAVRIAMSLGVSSWHRGFHNTSIAGVFGAVAAVSKLRGLSTAELNNAFGLACSFASGSMQYLENGAWNKRLHPAKASHDSFLIVAFAQAGVVGAAKPIEGKLGLIAAHTDGTPPPVNVSDLGSRWELLNTALKPYPGCRALHPVIELAALLRRPEKSPAVDVQTVHIRMDPSTYPVVGLAEPNKIHPRDTVDAQFSAYYQAAAAYLYGDGLGWAVYDHVADPAVAALTDKITIESTPMSNNLCTSMRITWADGSTAERTLEHPKWEEPQRPVEDAEVAAKFLSLATGSLGEDKAQRLVEYVKAPADHTQLVRDLIALVRV